MAVNKITFVKDGVQFDFQELIKQFKTKCHDFDMPLINDQASKAVEFASRVIFEISPESSKLKKKNVDKVWTCEFPYVINKTLTVESVFITNSTFKAEQPKVSSSKLILTVEQASLLSLMTLKRINELGINTPEKKLVMTPLASAVFSKLDLQKIALELDQDVLDILNAINASCQSGSQYLDDSRADIAAVATITTTKDIKDENKRLGIINKIVTRFLTRNKPFDFNVFNIYAKYAHGGVPQEYSPEELIKRLNDNQKRGRESKAAKMLMSNVIDGTVDVPSTPNLIASHVENKEQVSPTPKLTTEKVIPLDYEDRRVFRTTHGVPREYSAQELIKRLNDIQRRESIRLSEGFKMLTSNVIGGTVDIPATPNLIVSCVEDKEQALPTCKVTTEKINPLDYEEGPVQRTTTATKRQILLLSSFTEHASGYLEYATHDVEEFLKECNVNRILLVPYALKDYDEYTEKISGAFKKMGFSIESIHNFEDPAQAVKEAESFFVDGEDTFQLLDTLYDNKLIHPIRKRVLEDGVPYIGSSAGSNVAAVSICATNDVPTVYPPSFSVFGLVPFIINPHYLDTNPETHMGESREDAILQYHEIPESPPVVGLREGCFLRIIGDKMTLLGTHPARLFFPGKEPEEYDPGSDLSFVLQYGC